MFASASASLASRVPVRLGERRGRSAAKVNTSARAATTYTLDGKGCAGARTGDTGEFKNNIVAYKKRDAPACPIKPIAVTELCASHEGGKFKMLDAIFEQVGDDLYIYGCKPDDTYAPLDLKVDGRPVPSTSWSKLRLKPGQLVCLGGECFTVFRNVVAHA